MIKVANVNKQECKKAWLMELRMLWVKVRGRETQKKNLGGRKVIQVKGFVSTLHCLPCSITAKGSH